MNSRRLKLSVLIAISSILQGIASPAGAAPLAAETNLRDATAAITGIENGGQFGHFVENGGDLTGDGTADLVVGAWEEAGGAGRVYVFEGGPDLAGSLSATDAFASFEGRPTDRAGTGGVVGDIDGDGNDDLVISGDGIDGDANDSGGAYVFYGPLDERTDEQPMLEPDATLLGESAIDGAGLWEVEVGDVDGDEYPDMIIGAHVRPATEIPEGMEGPTGSVYIVYGDGSQLDGDVHLADAVELSGTPGVDRELGRHMAIGELGDPEGLVGRDLVLCAELAFAASGRCYIVFGGARETNRPIEEAADASIIGVEPGELLCCATVADHDADGLDDLIILGPLCRRHDRIRGDLLRHR